MATNHDRFHSDSSSLFAREDEYLLHARQNTQKHGLPEINIEPQEGQFLQFLAFTSGSKKALEIGTQGGYSGIWIARGLQSGGKLISIEKEVMVADVAREHFIDAGLGQVIEVRVGDPLDILDELRSEAPFDFIFINADKPGYPNYLDWAIENLQSRGIIAAHTPFQNKAEKVDLENEHIELMRMFNQLVRDTPLFTTSFYPAGDGTLVAVKNS